MAIIMLNARQMRIIACIFVIMCASAKNAESQENQRSGLTITGSASSDIVGQSIESESLGRIDQTTLTIEPRLNASYQSRTFSGLFSGSVTHLERDTDVFTQEDTYFEYSYTAIWDVVDSFLRLQANGALNYQNAFAGVFLSNDFLNDQGELIKTRSNQIAALLNTDRNDYVKVSGNLSYSQVRSEQNPLGRGVGLNNDIYSLLGEITEGDRVRNFSWIVQGSFQDSNPEQGLNNGFGGAQGNFTNRNVIGDLDIILLRNWAIRLTAQHEGNQLANNTSTFQNVREFNTYGAGITYRLNDSRYMSVSYSTIDSDIERDDGDSFVGIDFQWAFTERTGVQARYTRRFFGESGNFSLTYNTKRLRTSLTYTEDVTTNSLLLSNPENLGVFVCPAGETSIGQCFQPNSLNYQPQINEQLVQFSANNLEINDNVILRKASNTQIGYSFSRVTIGLFGIYSEETFLDADAVRRTLSAGFDLSYDIGSYTQLTSRVAYAEILGIGENQNQNQGIIFQAGENQNWNASLGFNRQVGEHLDINAEVSMIEQSGDMQLGLFGSEFKDRRISIGITYRYR